MTLILTVLHRDMIAQVSDMRVTSNGAYEDVATKLLFYVGFKEQRVVATTGLAVLQPATDPVSIDEWLASTIPKTKGTNFKDHILAVLKRLDHDLSATREIVGPRLTSGISLLFAGFDPLSGSPSLIVATNRPHFGSIVRAKDITTLPFPEDDEDHWLEVGEFAALGFAHEGEQPLVLAHGNVGALASEHSRDFVGRISQEVTAGASQETICKLLLEELAIIAENDKAGLISSSAWATTHPKESPIGLMQTSADESGPVSYLPRLIGPELSTRTHVHRANSSEEDSEMLRQFAQMDRNTVVSETALRIYLKFHQTIEQWSDILATFDVELGRIGELQRELAMLKKAHIIKIEEVDRLIQPDDQIVGFFNGLFKPTNRLGDHVSLDRQGLVYYSLIAKRSNLFTPEELVALGDGMPHRYWEILETLAPRP